MFRNVVLLLRITQESILILQIILKSKYSNVKLLKTCVKISHYNKIWKKYIEMGLFPMMRLREKINVFLCKIALAVVL